MITQGKTIRTARRQSREMENNEAVEGKSKRWCVGSMKLKCNCQKLSDVGGTRKVSYRQSQTPCPHNPSRPVTYQRGGPSTFLSRVHTSEPSEGEVGFGAPACQVFSSTELVENLELLCQRTNSFTFPFTFTSPTQLKLTHGAQHETTQKPFRLESVSIMEPKTTQSTARNKKIKSLYENELQV